MKQILVFAALLGCVEIILSCQSRDQQKTNVVGIDTAAIMASVDSVGRAVQKAHDIGDFKMLGATWAKDGIFSMAGSAPVFGRDAIVSSMASMPPLPPGATMQIHPISIEVLGPTSAYVFGIDTLKYTPAGSKVVVKETSTFFVLVKKTSEGWQTYREILSPNQPQNSLAK